MRGNYCGKLKLMSQTTSDDKWFVTAISVVDVFINTQSTVHVCTKEMFVLFVLEIDLLITVTYSLFL